ncbi:MAG: type II toxin-antitoxin system VapC family toxin [Propionibacteriaceae bacterium]|nr:type II toxin-antitoxin system VapC family toxin [Propionibacteriaceae bacterium]
MIVLDTNVVTEPMRAAPSSVVLAWGAKQTDTLALTSVTVGELLIGVALLPDEPRRKNLQAAVDQTILKYAACLPYTREAALIHAELRALARFMERPLKTEDGMIAAICASWGATLATRNVQDFDFIPIPVINPWESL